MHIASREVNLSKRTERRLNDDMIAKQVSQMTSRATGKTLRAAGWRAKPTFTSHQNGAGWVFDVAVKFTRKSQRSFGQEVFDRQWVEVQRRFTEAGRRWGWMDASAAAEATQEQVAEQAATPEPVAASTHDNDLAGPNWMEPFSHIFDRDAQIRIVRDAILSAQRAGFRKRNHCLLYGKPACGKTEIMLAFEKLLGKENVLKLDATMTTKAGAENLLLELAEIPSIIVIEEIEKCNPANLPWLLGVLDQRGEIVKTNSRIGSVRRDARCLCLATANNLPEFESVMSGALASRFQHKIHCPRPSREVLEKILLREVREIDGKEEWIQPALDHCLNVEKTDDPRRIIAVLDGGDRLLSGEYQRDLAAIAPPV